MIKPSSYANCSEFYEIEKTVEFVIPHGGEDTTFRIEALLDLKSGRYSTRVSYHENFRLQTSYPVVDGKFGKVPGDFAVWVPYPNAPWVDADTADSAIERSLGFLGAH